MFRIASHYFDRSLLILLFIEAAVLLFSAFVGTLVRFPEKVIAFDELRSFIIPAIIFVGAMTLSMSAMGMYQNQASRGSAGLVSKLGSAYVISFILISVAFFVAPSAQMGRGVLALIFVVSSIGLLSTRLIFMKQHRSGRFASRVLVLGSGELAKECGDLAESLSGTSKYTIVGYLRVENEPLSVSEHQLVARKSTLFETARHYNAMNVVVALHNKRGENFPLAELLECKLRGIQITEASDFFERQACQIRVKSLHSSWLVFGGGFDQSDYRIFCKRAFDIAVSVSLALISIPVMAITTVMILLEDRGPIFYSQERVGLGGRTYMVHKFRSMACNAEQIGRPQWAMENDPRVTRVGGIIRKLRIDELPQLFNVLLGEMSFVGPRPERPYFVEQLSKCIPYYDLRHSIKPGITGMAQVRYAYGASVEDSLQKLQYDLYYVKNNSLFLDILILIDTVQVVLLGKGAR